MQTANEYIPGTCNIGPAEMKKRKSASIFSFVLTIIVIALIVLLDTNRYWRLSVFLPAAAFAVNIQQVYFSFCVNFGWRGIFNFGGVEKHDSVAQAEFRKKDRRKAIQMIVMGTVIGLVVAVVFYLLPF